MENPKWEQNYVAGREINGYPIDDLVSSFFRFRNVIPRVDESQPLRALELGCGCGNNLWFLAHEGCDTLGIDLSATAIQKAEDLFRKKQLTGKFKVLNFIEEKLESNSFDFVVDRACLTHNPQHLNDGLQFVFDCLRPGGLMYCWMFGWEHSDRQFGEEYGYHCYKNFKNSAILIYPTYFLHENDIEKVFHLFNVLNWRKFVVTDSNNVKSAYFTLVLQKPRVSALEK